MKRIGQPVIDSSGSDWEPTVHIASPNRLSSTRQQIHTQEYNAQYLLGLGSIITGVILAVFGLVQRRGTKEDPVIALDLEGSVSTSSGLQYNTIAMATVSGESNGGWKIGHVSATEPGYRVITQAEIPGVVPRADLMDQVSKWATLTYEDAKSEGVAITITPQVDAEGHMLSFLISLPTEGGGSVVVQACFDDEEFIVQRGIDGFGKEVAEVDETKPSWTVKGRTFMLRRKEGDLPDEVRPLLLKVLQGLCQSVTNYYAFGSVYATDAT